jgi:ribosomal protein S27AE
MPSVELAALVLVLAMLVIGWGDLIAHRRSLPRMWAVLARKPYGTRRAHILRQLVFGLEVIWVLMPGLTAMLLAMLLGLYLVDVAGWPDVVGVSLFLTTGVSVMVAYGVRHGRLVRRRGLTCPGCGVPLVDADGLWFVKTGKCPKCSTALFGTHRWGESRADG